VWLIASRALTRGDLRPSRARRSGAAAVSVFELLSTNNDSFRGSSPSQDGLRIFKNFHLASYRTWCYRVHQITVLGRQPGPLGHSREAQKPS
jgi:hypothetical protein